MRRLSAVLALSQLLGCSRGLPRADAGGATGALLPDELGAASAPWRDVPVRVISLDAHGAQTVRVIGRFEGVGMRDVEAFAATDLRGVSPREALDRGLITLGIFHDLEFGSRTAHYTQITTVGSGMSGLRACSEERHTLVVEDDAYPSSAAFAPQLEAALTRPDMRDADLVVFGPKVFGGPVGEYQAENIVWYDLEQLRAPPPANLSQPAAERARAAPPGLLLSVRDPADWVKRVRGHRHDLLPGHAPIMRC